MSENPNSSPEPDTLERLVADSPSIEVISSAWMLLMSAAAEKLGLTGADGDEASAFDPRESPHFDLDEARRRAYDAVGKISLDGSHHRSDIALRAARDEITL